MTNCLCMPSTFVEVRDDEVEYLEGGVHWWNILIAAGICAALTIALTALFTFGTFFIGCLAVGGSFSMAFCAGASAVCLTIGGTTLTVAAGFGIGTLAGVFADLICEKYGL